MPSPKPRSRKPFRLDVASAKTEPILEDSPLLPWPAAALGSGAVAALAGALLVCGLILLGWAGVEAVPLSDALAFAAQVWLLGHGAALSIAGLRIGLVPLGLTLIVVVLAVASGTFAFSQALLARPQGAESGGRMRLLLSVSFLFSMGYTVVAVIIAAVSGLNPTASGPSCFAVAFLGAVIAGVWRIRLRPSLPRWASGALRGAGAGLLGLVLVAAVVFAVGLVEGETRIAALEQSLGLDSFGALTWAVVAVLYLPTVLAWAASWVLGVGITLGDGSLIAPWATQLGMLPAIPMLAALPPDGSRGLEWWLIAGVLPGALAGVVAARHCGPRPVAAIGAGASGGLIAGFAFLGWALVSRGALGTVRFALVGPRWPEAMVGVGTLTVSAAIAATLAWLLLNRGRRTPVVEQSNG